MENLIKALQIFLKYGNHTFPTHCEHDILFVMEYEKDDISEEDQEELKRLGFSWSDDHDCYISFRYGSA